MRKTGYFVLATSMAVVGALSTMSSGKPSDECYGSANMLCCDITTEFKVFCSGVPGGYCYGTVDGTQNTITPVQIPGRELFCVGLLPDEENGELCDDM